MNTPTAIVAYLALFAAAGFAFLFINLLVGHFLRPKAPNVEKLEIYECGEPTIGSSFVQFDLRFYVVALLFLIFDVEMAFFFPWGTVFGKAILLEDHRLTTVERAGDDAVRLSPAAEGIFRELGVAQPTVPELAATPAGPGDLTAVERGDRAVKDLAHTVALVSIADIAVFFGVLLVGFAYVWKRGDLDWVRAVSRERASPLEREPTPATEAAPLTLP